MALNPPFTVRIEKPDTSLADAMSEMREWLDHHQVKPVEFKIALAMTGVSGIVFDIRFQREEEAVTEALSLWEERERARIELLAGFDEAEADLKAGHCNDYTNETLPQLADELKREARALRDSKQPS